MKNYQLAAMNLYAFGKLLIVVALISAAFTTARGETESLAGNWTGSYQTPGPAGRLDINLTKNETDWSGVVRIEGPGGRILEKPVRNIVVEGRKLSFMIEFAGAEITFAGSLSDGKLSGELVGIEDGKTVARGSWQLSRPAKQSSE